MTYGSAAANAASLKYVASVHDAVRRAAAGAEAAPASSTRIAIRMAVILRMTTLLNVVSAQDYPPAAALTPTGRPPRAPVAPHRDRRLGTRMSSSHRRPRIGPLNRPSFVPAGL